MTSKTHGVGTSHKPNISTHEHSTTHGKHSIGHSTEYSNQGKHTGHNIHSVAEWATA